MTIAGRAVRTGRPRPHQSVPSSLVGRV